MNNTILTYIIIPVLIIGGIKGIYSFYKNDGKEYFNRVYHTEPDSSVVKKTIGRKKYIRYQNLIWGIICLFAGIGILISELSQ